MKKILCMILISASLSVPAFAEENVKYDIVDYNITVNDAIKEVGASIIVINDRTYLPVRAVSELLDLYVVWNDDERRIEISDTGVTFDSESHTILDSTDIPAVSTDIKIKVDGYEKTTENKVVIINGVSYLPVRELSEILGFAVGWEEENKTVSISIPEEEQNDEELYRYKQGDLWGYMDKNGDVKITPQFKEAYDFSEGLAIVGISSEDEYFTKNHLKKLDTDISYGYINERGEFVLPPIYYEAYDFSEGLAAVVLKKGYEQKNLKYDTYFESMGFFSFIDASGKVVISGDYPLAQSFESGYASVCDVAGQWGVVNKDGAFKKLKGEKESLIYGHYVVDKKILNGDSEVVFDASEYDKVQFLSDKFITVIKNDKCGLIDFDGNVLIDCQYDFLGYMAGENTVVFGENGKRGYIDLNGNIVIPAKYDYVWTFEDDISVVWEDDKCSIINRNGEVLADDVEDDFIVEKIFSKDMIRMIDENHNVKYIDSTGKTIEPKANVNDTE